MSALVADPKLLAEMSSPWKLRLWMMAKLPLAWLAGLRMEELTADRCRISVPYRWLSQNPFRSTYFAALSMAAEMSTGALGLLAVRSAPSSVAVIITGLEGQFLKKATGVTTFTCEAGPAFFAAVEETLRTGQGVTVRAPAIGRAEDGTEISRFTFEWSFKRRTS